MLRSEKTLQGKSVMGSDGEVGTVAEFLFDDTNGKLRYLVVNIGNWLLRKEILVSPEAIVELGENKILLNLNKELIENSPLIEEKRPLYIQKQIELHQYFNWSVYWDSNQPITPFAPPEVNPSEVLGEEKSPGTKKSPLSENYDPHLRSTRQIIGYRILEISKTGGEENIGKVLDFVINFEKNTVEYIVGKMDKDLGKKEIMIPRTFIKNICFDTNSVELKLSKADLEGIPEFDPQTPINKQFEEKLLDFYGRPVMKKTY